MNVLLGNNSGLLKGYTEYGYDINRFLNEVYPGEASKIIVNSCLCSCVNFKNLNLLISEIVKRVSIGGYLEITEPYLLYILKLYETQKETLEEINNILFFDIDNQGTGNVISCVVGPEEIQNTLSDLGLKNISYDIDKNTCTYTIYGERVNG